MDPMVEFDALMANPYPVAIPLMLLGFAMLGFALREGFSRPRHAGVGCLGLACGVWLAASLVETPAERAIPVVEGLVAEVCRGQIEAARARLHPDAGWAVGDEQSPRQDFATLDRQIARAARYRFSSWTILRIEGTTLRSDRVHVELKVRVVDEGRPIATTWRIELREESNRWQVTDVLWRTLLGQKPPSRMP